MASGLDGGAARAHAIESSLERLQSVRDGLTLQSHFSSGDPTANALVRLVPPGGGPAIEVGRTDGSGRLSFALPKGANGTWEVQVDGGPGHRDYLELPVTTGTAQLDRLSQQSSPANAPFGLTPLHGLLLLGSLGGLGGVLAAERLARRGPRT
ncbi:hypothetical protein KBY88_13020 [Cyanobium sp. Morenito 9A2]|nr:hypothetical protein [Cyanobium sp. Morenito 9A2]